MFILVTYWRGNKGRSEVVRGWHNSYRLKHHTSLGVTPGVIPGVTSGVIPEVTPGVIPGVTP